MPSLAEALSARPLDTSAVEAAVWELGRMSDEDMLTAITEARRRVLFDGDLATWDFCQATIRWAKSLLGLRPEIRRVCLEYLGASWPQ